MGDHTILDWLCEKLVKGHGAHTILLYGSRADGSASEDSDFDVAAFAPVTEPFRVVFCKALEPSAKVEALAELVLVMVGEEDA